MEPLQKSVEPPQPKKTAFPWIGALAAVLAGSLTANLILHDEMRQEERQHDAFARKWRFEMNLREDAERRLSDLRREIRDVTGNHWSYGLSTEAGRLLWRACLRDPSSLVFAPVSLHWQIDDKIRFDNPAPIENDAGMRFRPGESCRLASDTDLRIIRAADVFSIRLTVDGSYGATCPDGAYVNVSERNDIVDDAVSDGCMKKAKAFELSLADR